MQQPPHVPINKRGSELFSHMFLHHASAPEASTVTMFCRLFQQIRPQHFQLFYGQAFWPASLPDGHSGFEAVVLQLVQPFTDSTLGNAKSVGYFIFFFALSTQKCSMQ